MKQTTLWDMKAEDSGKQPIVLYEPLARKQQECREVLHTDRVTDLIPIFLQIKKILVAHFPVMMTPKGEEPLPQCITDTIAKKGNLNKNELVEFISFFLSDTRNFSAYFKTLDENVQKVWVLIVENYFASNNLLKIETGEKWMQIENSSYFYYSASVSISEMLPWFFYMRSNLSNSRLDDYYLFIPLKYRRFLYPVFLTQKINLFPPLTALPPEEPLLVFNGEKQIFKLLPVLDSLYRQDLIQIAKCRISAASLKKAGKLLNVGEFFTETADKAASQLCSNMLLSAYGVYQSMANEENEPEVLIKKLVEKIIKYPAVLLALALPHINGIRQNMLDTSYAPLQALHILQLLSSGDTDKWMDVENIRLKLYVMEQNGCQNVLFPGHILQKAEFTNVKHNKEYILLDDVYHEIGVPFIKGFLFLLASFGVLEVAYGEYDPESTSYSCSLRYVRLTSLGKYVLNLQKEYILEISDEQFFEINSDDLIVRSISEDNPYEALLSNFATSIGGHRYKVTFSSFLNNCTDIKDIEDKISFFRKHVCKQPPENWEGFFHTLLLHCGPLKEVSDEKYHIYQLDAQDKELQHLVSTDPYLRQYTKRAEDYLLLIETKHLREVINRLKAFGYLL